MKQRETMVTRVGRQLNLPLNRSRSKPAFDFKDYIEKQDYVGALAILEFGQGENLSQVDRLLWFGYCAFRLDDFKRSEEVYLELLSEEHKDTPQETGLYLACVYYAMHLYAKAEETALAVTGELELKNRILLHIARKNDDESQVAKYRQLLHDSKEDKLSAATIEFSFRHRFQEAADVYKRILVDDRNDLALNVYVAMCYFKMVGFIHLCFSIRQLSRQTNCSFTLIFQGLL